MKISKKKLGLIKVGIANNLRRIEEANLVLLNKLEEEDKANARFNIESAMRSDRITDLLKEIKEGLQDND